MEYLCIMWGIKEEKSITIYQPPPDFKTKKCPRCILRYRKVASSNTSCLEAHVGFFRLLIKGIFDPYVL